MLSWAWIRIDLCHLLAQTKPTLMVDLIPSLENEFGSINLGALINSFLNLNNLLFVVSNYFMESIWKLAYFSIIHCLDRVFFPHNPSGQVDLEYHLRICLGVHVFAGDSFHVSINGFAIKFIINPYFLSTQLYIPNQLYYNLVVNKTGPVINLVVNNFVTTHLTIKSPSNQAHFSNN